MDYPGRLIKSGEQDARIVKALKVQLNRALALQGRNAIRLDPDNPVFGPHMKQAVQMFQARHVDREGRPHEETPGRPKVPHPPRGAAATPPGGSLKTDGEVGAITWAALFGDDSVPAADQSADTLLARVLQIADAQEARHVREVPPNSNRGPDVEAYLRRAGVGPGLAWCCAFVYWCFDEAALGLDRANPMFKTAGCLAHWNGAPSMGARRLTRSQAVADPARVQPGMVFIMDFGGGAGHTGLVDSVAGGHIATIEGNTDASKTREGGGVYRLTRKLADVNKGFIDYAGL